VDKPRSAATISSHLPTWGRSPVAIGPSRVQTSRIAPRHPPAPGLEPRLISKGLPALAGQQVHGRIGGCFTRARRGRPPAGTAGRWVRCRASAPRGPAHDARRASSTKAPVRHRTCLTTGRRSRETVYVITDLTSQEASPQRLAKIIRSQWVIENRLHFVRDTTFREDASKIRSEHGPEKWPPSEASRSTTSEPPDTTTSPPDYARCPTNRSPVP
jgi:Transposase DDE domain